MTRNERRAAYWERFLHNEALRLAFPEFNPHAVATHESHGQGFIDTAPHSKIHLVRTRRNRSDRIAKPTR